MTKQDFIAELRKKLSKLPKQELEERLNFYCEMIDDRIEEGNTEEEAVLAIGSVNEIAEQILGEIPLDQIAKERIKPKKKLRAWEIVLLVLGSPIWISLGIAALAVILSVYVVLWSGIVSLWAVFVSVAACAPCLVAIGALFSVGDSLFAGIAMIGAGLFCAGIAIFLFFGCKSATKGMAILSKKIALGIKKCFV